MRNTINIDSDNDDDRQKYVKHLIREQMLRNNQQSMREYQHHMISPHRMRELQHMRDNHHHMRHNDISWNDIDERRERMNINNYQNHQNQQRNEEIQKNFEYKREINLHFIKINQMIQNMRTKIENNQMIGDEIIEEINDKINSVCENHNDKLKSWYDEQYEEELKTLKANNKSFLNLMKNNELNSVVIIKDCENYNLMI